MSNLKEQAHKWQVGKYRMSDAVPQADKIIQDLLTTVEQLEEFNRNANKLKPVWIQADIVPAPGQIVIFFEPGPGEPVWFGYYKDFKWWTIDDEEVYGVTHWMERPAPPQQTETV